MMFSDLRIRKLVVFFLVVVDCIFGHVCLVCEHCFDFCMIDMNFKAKILYFQRMLFKTMSSHYAVVACVHYV